MKSQTNHLNQVFLESAGKESYAIRVVSMAKTRLRLKSKDSVDTSSEDALFKMRTILQQDGKAQLTFLPFGQFNEETLSGPERIPLELFKKGTRLCQKDSLLLNFL